MPAANVTSVTMDDELTYGYISGDGCLWRYLANPGGTGSRTALKVTGAAPGADRPVQVVLGLDDQDNPVRHLFYRPPASNEIWHAVDDGDGTSDATLESRQVTDAGGAEVAMLKTFGAVSVADGVILVGAAPAAKKPSVQVVGLPWVALQPKTWMRGATSSILALPLKKDDSGATFDPDDTEVTCATLPNLLTGKASLSFLAKRKLKETEYLGCWTAQINDDLQLDELAEHPQQWTGKKIRFPRVDTLPNGNVVAYFINEDDDAQWFTITPTALLGGGDDGTQVSPFTAGTAKVDASLNEVMRSMSRASRTPGVSYGDNAFTLVFAYGTAKVEPGKQNPDLQDYTAELTAGVLFYNGHGTIVQRYGSALWGYLTRTALPIVNGKSLLLGIIEGPPPIPDENLNIDIKYDPLVWFGQPGYSMARFAKTDEQEGGWDLSWSAGAVFKAKWKFEFGAKWDFFGAKAWAQLEVTAKAAYKGARSEIETTQSVAAIQAGSEIQGGTGGEPYSVQKAGVLVVQNASWTGYSYAYTRPDGSLPDETVVRYDVLPTDLVVSGYPYLINPEVVGPQPGDISTYHLTKDERDALERHSIIDLGKGTGFLTGAWGYNTKTLPTFATTKSTKMTHGFNLSLDALLTLGSEKKLFGIETSGEVGLGIETTFKSSWSTTHSRGIEVGGEIWLRGNSKAPNSYAAYTYFLYLLEQDPQWAADLVESMVTDTFPAPGDARDQQIRLRDLVSKTFAPWKICYAVDPSTVFYNRAVADVLPTDPELESLLGVALHEAGITTTYQLDQVLSGSPDADVTEAATALRARLREDPALAQRLRAVVDAAARPGGGLSPAT